MKKKILIVCLMCITVCANAQYEYFNEEEKKVYDEFHGKIEYRVDRSRVDRYNETVWKYKVFDTYSNELYTIFENQERRKILYDFMYPDDHRTRYEKKQQVEDEYRDAIDRILLLSGNDISSPNLGFALQFRDRLELTTEQREELAAEALVNIKRLKEKPRRDLWKQELEVLQRVMNDKQFEFFFKLKNFDKCNRETRDGWKRLKEAGMTADLDSARACFQIREHKQRIKMATDIYTYDDAKKREAWSAIDQSAPLPVKRLYSLTRKNQAKKQGYRGSFNW